MTRRCWEVGSNANWASQVSITSAFELMRFSPKKVLRMDSAKGFIGIKILSEGAESHRGGGLYKAESI